MTSIACVNLRNLKEHVVIEVSPLNETVHSIKQKIGRGNYKDLYICYSNNVKFNAVEYFSERTIKPNKTKEEILQNYFNLDKKINSFNPVKPEKEHNKIVHKFSFFDEKHRRIPANPLRQGPVAQGPVAQGQGPVSQETVLQNNIKLAKNSNVLFDFTQSDANTKIIIWYIRKADVSDELKKNYFLEEDDYKPSAQDSELQLQLDLEQHVNLNNAVFSAKNITFEINLLFQLPLNYLYAGLKKTNYNVTRNEGKSAKSAKSAKTTNAKKARDADCIKIDMSATITSLSATTIFLYNKTMRVESILHNNMQNVEAYCADLKKLLETLMQDMEVFLNQVGYYALPRFHDINSTIVSKATFSIIYDEQQVDFKNEFYNKAILSARAAATQKKTAQEVTPTFSLSLALPASSPALASSGPAALGPAALAASAALGPAALGPAALGPAALGPAALAQDKSLSPELNSSSQDGGGKQEYDTSKKRMNLVNNVYGQLPKQMLTMLGLNDKQKYNVKRFGVLKSESKNVNLFLRLALPNAMPNAMPNARPEQKQSNEELLETFLSRPKIAQYLQDNFKLLHNSRIQAQFGTIAAFKAYLTENVNNLNYEYLWELIQVSYNLCILELRDAHDGISLICPKLSNAFDPQKKTIMLLQWIDPKESFYERVCYTNAGVGANAGVGTEAHVFPAVDKTNAYVGPEMTQIKTFLKSLPVHYSACDSNIDVNKLIMRFDAAHTYVLVTSSSNTEQVVGILDEDDQIFVPCFPSFINSSTNIILKSIKHMFRTYDEASLQIAYAEAVGNTTKYKAQQVVINVANTVIGVLTNLNYFVPIKNEPYDGAKHKLKLHRIISKQYITGYELNDMPAATQTATATQTETAPPAQMALEQTYVLFQKTVMTMLWNIQNRELHEAIEAEVKASATGPSAMEKINVEIIKHLENLLPKVVFTIDVEHFHTLQKKQILFSDEYKQHEPITNTLITTIPIPFNDASSVFYLKLAEELRHRPTNVFNAM